MPKTYFIELLSYIRKTFVVMEFNTNAGLQQAKETDQRLVFGDI